MQRVRLHPLQPTPIPSQPKLSVVPTGVQTSVQHGGWHALVLVEPIGEVFPLGQSVHVAAPPGLRLYVPALQLMHADGDAEATFGLYLPALQRMHEERD